jgi:hypothetical protein
VNLSTAQIKSRGQSTFWIPRKPLERKQTPSPSKPQGHAIRRSANANQTPKPHRRRRAAKAKPHLSAAASETTRAGTTAALATKLMESLEALVAHIQGLSGSPEEVAHLHSLLKQADGDSLRAHAAALVPFLAHLSPGAHSLGYLYLLYGASLPPSVRPSRRTLAPDLRNHRLPPKLWSPNFPPLFAAGRRARLRAPI